MPQIKITKPILRFVTFVIALLTIFLSWRILAWVYPYNNFELLSFEKTKLDYNIKRWATGAIVFGLIHIVISQLWKREMDSKLLNKLIFDLKSARDWIILYSTRIIFSIYLVSFWSNYVSYQWFSNLSYAIGGFGIEYPTRLVCILIQGLLGIYVIVGEPWIKTIVKESPAILEPTYRVSSIVVTSIAFYLLGLTKFPGNNLYPVLITLTFALIVGLVMVINASFYTSNKASPPPIT